MRHSRLAQSYQYTPPSLEVTTGEFSSRAQSSRWTCHTIEQMHIPELKSAPAKQVCRERSEKKVRKSRLTHPAKVLVRKRSAALNLSEIHHANICRNLERRIQAARERGDEQLLRSLMAEMTEIVCAIAN